MLLQPFEIIRMIFLFCSISFVKCFVKKYGLTINKGLANTVILKCSVQLCLNSSRPNCPTPQITANSEEQLEIIYHFSLIQMVIDPIIAAVTCILGHLSVHGARALNGYYVEDSNGQYAASL